MEICNFSSNSILITLKKGMGGGYWIRIRTRKIIPKGYISLYYPKLQAYKIYIKFLNYYLTKSYIHY